MSNKIVKNWSPLEEAWQYNSTKEDVLLKEYGRKVQKLGRNLQEEPDREKRTRLAFALIELMRHLNPAMQDGEEHDRKLWDHLHYITNYQLDVDSPYPMPDIEIRRKRPQKMDYPNFQSMYRNYGENLENLVHEVGQIEGEEKQMGAINYLGKLMKSFTLAWTNDFIDDEVLIGQIKNISQGKLMPMIEKMKAEDKLDFYVRLHGGNRNNNSSNNSGGKKGGKRKHTRKKHRNR